MKKFTTLATLTLLTLVATVAPAVQVLAVNDTSGQALEIAPPVVALTADPGQKLDTQINLRDISSSPLVVTGTLNDFSAQGEDGNPKSTLTKLKPVLTQLKAGCSHFSNST